MTRRGWAVLAVSLLGLAAACRRSSAEPPALQPPANEVWLPPEQAASLRSAVVRTEDVQDSLRVGGKVTFDDLRVSHVFSPVTGRVMKVLVGPGDRVKKGTPLAVISSPDIGSAWSDVVKARAALDASQREFQRQRELYDAHAGPLRDLEAAESTYKQAKAELERAEAKARLLHTGGELGAEDFILRAPIDGEVVSRSVNPGVELQGTFGGGTAVELFTVGELDQVIVLGDLHEQDMSTVKAGADVDVRVVSAPDTPFHGKVDWVSTALDPATHTAKIRIRVANPDRVLKAEMYATVAIPLTLPPTVALPRSALLHLGDQTVVFVALGESPDKRLRFERRRVQVNEDVTGPLYPVLSGLSAGETVVVEGALLLSGVT
ncbi:MAG: efflux RND transporter periplasmic adaptor subunit [Myxococcaceae bacterium]